MVGRRHGVLAQVLRGFVLGFSKGGLPLPLETQGKWLNLWDLCDLLWIDVSCLLLAPPFFKAADLILWFFHLQSVFLPPFQVQ